MHPAHFLNSCNYYLSVENYEKKKEKSSAFVILIQNCGIMELSTGIRLIKGIYSEWLVVLYSKLWLYLQVMGQDTGLTVLDTCQNLLCPFSQLRYWFHVALTKSTISSL